MNKKKYYLFQMKMVSLNIFSLVLLFLMLIVTYFIDDNLFKESFNYIFGDMHVFAIFMIIYLLYMVLHEMLHSLGYVIYGAKFKNIVYGIEAEKGVFYCLCKQNINKVNILNSLFFPLFYIGIVTYILGIIFDAPLLLMLSIFNISGCSGDIMMFIFISRLRKDIEFSELDDATSFAIYSSYDVSEIKHYGLKYIKETDKIERKNKKKISISKFSIVFLLILVVLILFLLFKI